MDRWVEREEEHKKETRGNREGCCLGGVVSERCDADGEERNGS